MMKTLMIMAVCLLATGCANLKYPNWQYVRIESEVPNAACVYKMQEPCSEEYNGCINWYKRRATTFDANTVVVVPEPKINLPTSVLIGQVFGNVINSSIADYYQCESPKNIKPKG